ncbi:MAG: hypothetical protein ACKPKO_43180, partial [Candidatus Fonsibacter sp.]
ENEMVDFYKQFLSAQSRGQLETFAYHILASRHWGVDHQSSDTSLVTIRKPRSSSLPGIILTTSEILLVDLKTTMIFFATDAFPL